MSTVRVFLTDAMAALGLLAANETMNADDGALALRTLNRLVETWNAQHLMVYTINRNTFPLTINQQSYTLGTGGNFNITRPVRIENASIIPTASDSTLEIPIAMLRDEEWREVSVKSITSTFPTMVYPQGNYPLNTLSFWPVPTTACSVVLYTWGQIQPFSTLDDSFALPNGYEEPLLYMTAIRLASAFGLQPPQSVISLAMEGKRFIAAQNWTPDELVCDQGVLRNTGLAKANRSFGYYVD